MARTKKREDKRPEYILGHYSLRPFDDDGTPPRLIRSKIVTSKQIRKLKSK